MLAHPQFPNIKLHSDDGLRTALAVLRAEGEDGRVLAYKSQLPPTVEPAFYAAASSSLCPAISTSECWTGARRWPWTGSMLHA